MPLIPYLQPSESDAESNYWVKFFEISTELEPAPTSDSLYECLWLYIPSLFIYSNIIFPSSRTKIDAHAQEIAQTNCATHFIMKPHCSLTLRLYYNSNLQVCNVVCTYYSVVEPKEESLGSSPAVWQPSTYTNVARPTVIVIIHVVTRSRIETRCVWAALRMAS